MEQPAIFATEQNKVSKIYDVIVVGGGAAGLLAAGAAAESGAKVLLFEKMKKTGRKIGISGKGRCNITNNAELTEFMAHFGKNGKFLRGCFSKFFSEDIIELIQKQGIEVTLERGGRYFPTSGKALDIVQALGDWVDKLGVHISRNQPIKEIMTDDHGKIVGVRTKKIEFNAHTVILATGGASYPRTGSTGDGYKFAAQLGHRIIPVRPALVPLNSDSAQFPKLTGLDLKHVEASLLVNGKNKGRYFGDLSFTSFGLSGPTILTLSGLAVDALDQKEQVTVSIDLKPALDIKKLDARIVRDLTSRHSESIELILRGLIPRQLIPICLQQCKIAAQTSAGTFPAVLRKQIVHWLKNFTIEVTGYRSFAEAIITAGGVSIKDVNPTTMESRKIEGLYIAGELLDLQGDTGGYNLQAAFSTGWLAGKSAAAVAATATLNEEGQ